MSPLSSVPDLPEEPKPIPRPIRSILFVPGNREDRMRKSLTVGADAVIYDLEGAVPRGELPEARKMVARVIADSDPEGPAIFVRVGDSRSGDRIRADMGAAIAENCYGLLLPQVAGVDDVTFADKLIGELEEAAGVTSGHTILVPLMETANAVRTAYEIATCSPRIAYMGSGISKSGDIARSIGYRATPAGLETLFMRSKVLIDVRSAGIVNPISGMWSEIDDLEGLRRFSEFTRELGYDGMMAIHPSHIPVINEVFTPTAEEIAGWREVIEVMTEAQRNGVGAIRMHGTLVDEAHVLTAEQNLAFAERLGLI
jgi:citrate lyase subunit beta/citryl-CoA lyase